MALSAVFGVCFGIAILAAFQAANPVEAYINVLVRSVVQPISQVAADPGYVLTFWAMAAAVVVALLIALVMRHGRQPSTAGVVA